MRFGRPLLVLAAGLALGYWMFGNRGAVLFGCVALACYFGRELAAHYSERVANGALLLLAAVSLYACSTRGWGGAEAPDGSRFKASPVGLSHVLTPGQTTSRTEDCGWYDASGYTTPCAIADRDAFAELRWIYPMVLTGAALCAFAALLSFVRTPRALRGQRTTACVASGLAIAAPVLFVHTLSDALAALQSLTVGVGGSLGTMLLSAAILLSLAVCLSPTQGRLPLH